MSVLPVMAIVTVLGLATVPASGTPEAAALGAAPAAASKEQSDAVLQSCFAIFQLGVAIALEKFDAPEESEEAEKSDAEAIDTTEADKPAE